MTEEPGGLNDRFELYEREVKQYGRNWTRGDRAATRVINRDAIVASEVSALRAALQPIGTQVVYECDERWLPERLNVHHRVVRQLVEPSRRKPNGTSPAGRMRQAIVLMGAPGSGKTTLLRPIARELIRRIVDEEHIVFDADDVRTHLPEYRKGLGSEIVQYETAKVAYGRFVEEAYRQQANLIIDIVGNPKDTVADVRYLSRAGWSVWCLCARVDLKVALRRVRERAVVTGRYVPLGYVEEVGDRPVNAFVTVRDSGVPLAGVAMFDTSNDGSVPPTVIESSDKNLFGPAGRPTVVWPEQVRDEIDPASAGETR